jgi:hypothetical protein
MRTSAFVALTGLFVFGGGRPAAQGRVPPLNDLLRRVGGYVQSYGEKASLVVATERYEQHETDGRAPERHRQLVSEFAIVHDDRLEEWLGFREVIDVDGKAITDHEHRLVSILTSPYHGLSEARALSDDGARFNLGILQPNFNVPTAALFFFKPRNLDRFKFTERGLAADGSIDLAFRENHKPTIIETPDGGSLQSEGDIWFDLESGAIRRTRLRLGDLRAIVGKQSTGSVEVDVTYAFVDDVGMWLPETMREEYDVVGAGGTDRVTGHADYSNYRRFQTTVRIK